jgi:formate hydrogenlyase subunit 3/multisubunit Na+/H+ antiporter MnhD subunit
MTAPLIWIILPAMASAILYVLRRWKNLVAVAAVLLCIFLAWLAWILPIGEAVTLGTWPIRASIKISETMFVLGRQLIIQNNMRPLLILAFLSSGLWFAGSRLIRADSTFIPLGLSIIALLISALAVFPFLYAALFIEIAMILSIPVLSPPPSSEHRGTIRFLVLFTIGFPFILLAGWRLSGIEAVPGDPAQVMQITILLGLGFAFLMAVFPFHTWIPMISETGQFFPAAYILFILPAAVSIFAHQFLTRYIWIKQIPSVLDGIFYLGTAMVLLSGLWAAFQRHAGRIFGFAVLMEIGFTMIAFRLDMQAPQIPALSGIFYASLLPRCLALLLASICIGYISINVPNLEFRSIQGIARQLPLAAIGVLVSLFTLVGFPLTAGFPPHLALWTAVAQISSAAIIPLMLGIAGLLFSSFRCTAVMLMSPGDQSWKVGETRPIAAAILTLCLALVLLGIFPNWFIPAMSGMGTLMGIP